MKLLSGDTNLESLLLKSTWNLNEITMMLLWNLNKLLRIQNEIFTKLIGNSFGIGSKLILIFN